METQYVIKNERDLYFSQISTNHFTRTTSTATKFQTEGKANNAIKNLPKILKKYKWTVEEFEENDLILPGDNSYIEEINFSINDLLNKVLDIESFSMQLNNRLLQLRSQLSIADMERVDIEHKIEFEASNAAQGYKLYKLLHDTLNRRRQAKNEIDQINIILNGTLQGASKGEISQQLMMLNERTYMPRVLKELFE